MVGEVQIEVKYSEQFAGLNAPLSDGPYEYASGLSNSFRVETFNLTRKGETASFLLQGGQRWQSIKLLTNGSVALNGLGYKPSIDVVGPSNLAGKFESSSVTYNKIWDLGARACIAACFGTGTQKSIWEISDDGAFVRSTRPAYSSLAYNFDEYTLEFYTKIQRGGVRWAIGYPLSGNFGGIQFHLAGDYPSSSTYINVNRTLFPPSSIALAYGFSFVNQTTLTSYYLENFPAPFDIHEDAWHHISTTTSSGYLAVSVNRTQIFNISLSQYYITSSLSPTSISIPTTGSFGFGGWQDEAAYIRNVTATSQTGDIIYSNTMANESETLPEYGVHENYSPACLDGAKRDRLVWLGDFFHTSRIIGVSTSQSDFVKGTFSKILEFQLPSGQLPISPPMGYPTPYNPTIFSDGPIYVLADYHILGLISFVSYLKYSNDIEFSQQHWPSLKLAVDWLCQQRNSTTGLIDLSAYGFTFIGPASGSAVNGASVQALNGMALVATAVGDHESAISWSNFASSLNNTFNERLWNEKLGIYSIEEADEDNFSVAGIAFSITSGVASVSRALSSLSHVPSLQLGPGYKDSSLANSSDSTVNLSPNTNGFLLSALLDYKQITVARFLLENLWGAMIADEHYSSGASWEYVNQRSEPGLGLFTSLSHPWGGAPTYVLTEYIAGIRPVEFGYKTWIVEPIYWGLDLDSVSATVQTPAGNLSASWCIEGNMMTIIIRSPVGTTGRLVVRLLDGSAHTQEVSGGQSLQVEIRL